MRVIKTIVVHCSATANGSATTAADIDLWHREKGWAKIGYHYVIKADGTVEVGRDLEEVGAHVAGNNANTIGICMIGTDKFTAAQWQALERLRAELNETFPTAGWCGHRDYSPDKNGDGVIDEFEWMKTCPGFDVRRWLRQGPHHANML